LRSAAGGGILRAMRTFASILALLAAAACGGNVVIGDKDAGAGGSAGSGGAGGNAAAVDCTATGTGTFPTFSKTCAAAGDCAIGLHQINCCGTLTAIGLAASQQAAFAAAEATCEGQYPGCGCAGQATTAEDGKTADLGNSQIQVACTAGACSTYIP
jgi:hypothetical protein